MNVYPFIEAEKAGGHHVARACVLLQVSRAAYYHHRTGPSVRAQADVELTAEIAAVHAASNGELRVAAGARRTRRRRPPTRP